MILLFSITAGTFK
jgi:hypothetical protein